MQYYKLSGMASHLRKYCFDRIVVWRVSYVVDWCYSQLSHQVLVLSVAMRRKVVHEEEELRMIHSLAQLFQVLCKDLFVSSSHVDFQVC